MKCISPTVTCNTWTMFSGWWEVQEQSLKPDVVWRRTGRKRRCKAHHLLRTLTNDCIHIILPLTVLKASIIIPTVQVSRISEETEELVAHQVILSFPRPQRAKERSVPPCLWPRPCWCDFHRPWTQDNVAAIGLCFKNFFLPLWEILTALHHRTVKQPFWEAKRDMGGGRGCKTTALPIGACSKK